MIMPDEVVAKVWDDYLHRFGADDYVMARYLTPSPTMPMTDDARQRLRGAPRYPASAPPLGLWAHRAAATHGDAESLNWRRIGRSGRCWSGC
jgi:hypothetical protein